MSYAGLSFADQSPGLRENRRAPRNPSGFRRPAGHEPGLWPDTNFFIPHLPCIRYSRIERSCAVPFTYHAYRLSRTEQSCAVPRAASQQLQDHLLLRSESPTTLSKDHKTVLLLRSEIANHAEQRPQDRSALEKQNRQTSERLRSSCPATAGFVSGGRVRPEGPKERGGALRARSKMRGDPPFRVGERRLTRLPGSCSRRRRPPHPTR